jgi:hypothetical protein
MAAKKDKKWIQKAIKRPGAFTAKAKKAKKSVSGMAAAVRKNPERYSPTTVKQANLAVTLKKISKKRKKK